jgi:ABC-type antimicrobial peptide transport system permease subunit
MALGADTARIAWAVLARGLGLAAAGGLAGLVLYALVAGPLQAAVPGLQAWDPVALVCSLFVLAAMTAIASWAPARRAAAVDPALAMRAD